MKKNQFWQQEYDNILAKRKKQILSTIENERLRELSKMLYSK